jgi:hypothetical protein
VNGWSGRKREKCESDGAVFLSSSDNGRAEGEEYFSELDLDGH